MTVLFLDNFNGSGGLLGHTPDVNTSAGAAWQPGSVTTSGYSGAEWQPTDAGQASAITRAQLIGGRLSCVGTAPGELAFVGIGLPGSRNASPFEDFPLPAESYFTGTYVVTWDWTPAVSSYLDPALDDPAQVFPFGIGAGSGILEANISRTSPRQLMFYGQQAAVSFVAGTTYPGEMRVQWSPDFSSVVLSITFLGVTIEQPIAIAGPIPLNWNPTYLWIGPGCSVGFLRIDNGSAPTASFWTNFRNAQELT